MNSTTFRLSLAAALIAALSLPPAFADGQYRSRARGVQFDNGARAAHSGAAARGPNGAAGGQRAFAADGDGNVDAAARGGFTTESGAQGARRASYERNDDGSAQANREGSFEGESRSGSHNRSYSRDADGNATAARNTTLTNEETGNSFSGSTSYSRDEGFSRSAGCSDADGNDISCGSR